MVQVREYRYRFHYLKTGGPIFKIDLFSCKVGELYSISIQIHYFKIGGQRSVVLFFLLIPSHAGVLLCAVFLFIRCWRAFPRPPVPHAVSNKSERLKPAAPNNLCFIVIFSFLLCYPKRDNILSRLPSGMPRKCPVQRLTAPESLPELGRCRETRRKHCS